MSLCSVSLLKLPRVRGPRRIVPGEMKDFRSSLKTLGLAIGFQDIITVYVIRPETGNMMNGMN